MEDLNWLTDLVSDCHAYGEKHDNELIMFSSQDVIAAIERDLGLKFILLPKTSVPDEIPAGQLSVLPANVIQMPSRPRKFTARNMNRPRFTEG